MTQAKSLKNNDRSLVTIASDPFADLFGQVAAGRADPPPPVGSPGGGFPRKGAVPLPEKTTPRTPRGPSQAAQAPKNTGKISPVPADLITGTTPPPEPKVLPTDEEAGLRRVSESLAKAATLKPEEWMTASNPVHAFVLRYRNDILGFVRNVLKADPTPDQVDFLLAVQRAERRISIRAGHGVGKSTSCSWAAIWHILCRFPQKTVATAPTAGQLFDAFFSELKSWIAKLPDVLKSLLEVQSDRILLRAAPERSFISARTSSADKPEALAGIHSENVLIICDEASAIPEAVYESAKGSMSGHSAITVLIGNPTRNAGLFFQTHHELKHRWTTLHWSCLNSPMVNQDFVQEIIDTYGEESNQYRVRVLGEFAKRDDDVLIPADLVDDAMTRDIALDADAPLMYGLDVARFGDDRSVLCKRVGSVVTGFKVWRNMDLMSLTGAVVNELREDGVDPGGNARPHEIMVDSIGLGSGVADRLRELGFNCRDVNVSESAAMNPRAAKMRDDLWLSLRDWLRARACRLPNDQELRLELVSPTYGFLSNGKLKVEGKADLKKRIRRSPDLADALCLTFGALAAAVGGRAARWTPGKALKRKIKGVR